MISTYPRNYLKRTLGILLVLALVLFQAASVYAASDVFMTRKEITTIIEETARRKNIPPEILKAIAWIESRKTQFTSSGAPLVSRGNRGLMQINNVHTNFDSKRILYDTAYNIEAGADILLSKWLDPRTPVVGSRDPNVLEHWYFALWAYNGWLSRNNPNLHGENTYQDKVFSLIRTRYGQEVSPVDWTYIPASGLPQWGLIVPEPSVTHEGGILFFQPYDRAAVDVRDALYVLKAPNDAVRFTLIDGDEVVVASAPQLESGLYWYEILHPATGQRGWTAGIYLNPVFVHQEAADDALWSIILEPEIPNETEVLQPDGMDPEKHNLEDPSDVEAEENQTMEAGVPLVYQDEPEHHDYATSDEPVVEAPPLFLDMVNHPALEAVENLAREGVFSVDERREFRPHQTISRQEMAVILDKFFHFEERILNPESVDQQLETFTDGDRTSHWARHSLARAVSLGVIGGYPDGTIRPLDAATREQGLVMVVKSMLRAEPLKGMCASRFFEDGEAINDWSLAAVNVLINLGVFDGLDHTYLHPQQELTRVELAVVLYRLHCLNNH